jgi:hypothetical protein
MDEIADQLILLHEGNALFPGRKEHAGIGRTTNSFEITTSLSEHVLQEQLLNIEVNRTRQHTTYCELTTPPTTERQQVLKALPMVTPPPTYIPDTSESSRRFLANQK